MTTHTVCIASTGRYFEADNGDQAAYLTLYARDYVQGTEVYTDGVPHALLVLVDTHTPTGQPWVRRMWRRPGWADHDTVRIFSSLLPLGSVVEIR